MSQLFQLAIAIAREEGFFDPPSLVGGIICINRPQRNKNPGDLRGWPGYGQDTEGFTIFPSISEGWTKLYQDLKNHATCYPEMSLLDFIAGDGSGWTGYAPAFDKNDSGTYALNIAKFLGVSSKTTFSELS